MLVFNCDVIAWQPIATISSGLLAVLAAGFIGLKQIRISGDQAVTAELAQRERLFDKRFEFYMDLRSYLSEVRAMGSSTMPGPEQLERADISAEKAQFLFSPKSQSLIAAVRAAADTYTEAHREYCATGGLDEAALRIRLDEINVALKLLANGLSGEMALYRESVSNLPQRSYIARLRRR